MADQGRRPLRPLMMSNEFCSAHKGTQPTIYSTAALYSPSYLDKGIVAKRVEFYEAESMTKWVCEHSYSAKFCHMLRLLYRRTQSKRLLHRDV